MRYRRGIPGGTPFNGLYEEASHERGTIFWLQVLGVGIALLEVYEQYMKLVGNLSTSSVERPKTVNRCM